MSKVQQKETEKTPVCSWPAAVVAAIKAVQLLQDLPWLLGGGCVVQVDQADARLHLKQCGGAVKSEDVCSTDVRSVRRFAQKFQIQHDST